MDISGYNVSWQVKNTINLQSWEEETEVRVFLTPLSLSSETANEEQGNAYTVHELGTPSY